MVGRTYRLEDLGRAREVLAVSVKHGFGQIDLGVCTPQPVTEALARAFTAGAVFTLEATSGEALRKALTAVEGTAVPRIVRALTSRRTVTMEWAPGRNL